MLNNVGNNYVPLDISKFINIRLFWSVLLHYCRPRLKLLTIKVMLPSTLHKIVTASRIRSEDNRFITGVNSKSKTFKFNHLIYAYTITFFFPIPTHKASKNPLWTIIALNVEGMSFFC